MKSRELLKLLKQNGWYELRQSGSHIIMEHSTNKNKISIPFHTSKEIKKGTLKAILKLAEIKTNKR